VGGPGYEPADDWAALAACLVITYSGLRLLRRAFRDVLDVAPSKEFEARVRDVAGTVDGVLAVEKCRIRKSGMRYFVEIHIEVDSGATVRRGHDIATQVRSDLRRVEPRIADALVHVEPYDA
jgi:divalent metal cation (Fe/Co/Zn/Cd) transporter